jgi:ABC-type multidrug transport system fused ATPase/permease subunit
VSSGVSNHQQEQQPEGVGRALRLLAELTRFHRLPFVVAVSGATVYAVCTVASSFAVSHMVDSVIIPGFENDTGLGTAFFGGSLLIIGVGILRAIGVVVRRSFAGVTQWWTVKTLAMVVTRKVASQPPAWHRSKMTGDIIARTGVDAEAATAVLGPLPFGTSVLVLLVVSGVWLVLTDPILGVVALTVIPFLVMMNVGYHRLVERHYRAAQEHLGAFSEAVFESLEGVSVVKAFGAESRETARLSGISSLLRDARSRAVRIRANFEGLLDAVPSLVNVSLLVIGARRVDAGHLTVGELSGFIYLFTLLVFPLRIIGYVLSEVPHSMSGWTRIRGILDEPLMRDPRSTVDTPKEGVAIELAGVSFLYPGSATAVLDEVDLAVRRGAIVALVGATGSGKSTVLRIASANMSPQVGRVAIDAGDTAVVFQDAFLFAGSVRENVSMGDRTMTDDEIWAALHCSAMDEFVRELAAGLDTEVGERGVSLSGGQRQRLALARAVARRASVLLVDDATSALDPATEATVLARLAALEPRRTILIVASRPSAIALADEVIFLDNGRVAGRGAPDELVRHNDRYRAIVESYATDRAEGTGR